MADRDFSDVPYLVVGAVVAVQEEIERAADRLIEKGKSLTPEGRKKMMEAKKGLVSKGDDFSVIVAKTVQRVLENAGIVTESDLEGLEKRVENIEKKVSGKKPSKKVVVKKTGQKKSKPAKKKAKPAKKKAAKKTKTSKTAKKKSAKKPAKKKKK